MTCSFSNIETSNFVEYGHPAKISFDHVSIKRFVEWGKKIHDKIVPIFFVFFGLRD